MSLREVVPIKTEEVSEETKVEPEASEKVAEEFAPLTESPEKPLAPPVAPVAEPEPFTLLVEHPVNSHAPGWVSRPPNSGW